MQAATLYYEEFRRRGEAAASQQFGRQELLTEAAHDAYQATSDRLTRDFGWEDERTLVTMRGLNAAVKRWLDSGGSDWDELHASLRSREAEMDNGPDQPGERPGTGRG